MEKVQTDWCRPLLPGGHLGAGVLWGPWESWSRCPPLPSRPARITVLLFMVTVNSGQCHSWGWAMPLRASSVPPDPGSQVQHPLPLPHGKIHPLRIASQLCRPSRAPGTPTQHPSHLRVLPHHLFHSNLDAGRCPAATIVPNRMCRSLGSQVPPRAGESRVLGPPTVPFRAKLGPESPSHASKARHQKNGIAGSQAQVRAAGLTSNHLHTSAP